MDSEPSFESVLQMSKERVHEVNFGKYAKPTSPVKTYNGNCLDNIIMYKVRVNNIKVDALYDTDVSISVMSKWFFDKL